jgi:hypothetical protein
MDVSLDESVSHWRESWKLIWAPVDADPACRLGDRRYNTVKSSISHKHDSIRISIRTPFATAGVSQLLQTTAHLLRGSSFASLVKDVIRDESVPHRKSAKESRFPGIIRLISFQP